MSAERTLIDDHQARVVLCAESKRPVRGGQPWNTRVVTADEAERHRLCGGLLGVIPSSIRATALDLDFGDPQQLLIIWPSWAQIPSRRADGLHIYFDDLANRTNAKWAAYECSGDLRGASGYLVMHEPRGPELLLEALERRVEGANPFPVELLEHELGRSARGKAGANQDRSLELPLEHVFEPGRADALFSVLSRWAYAHRQQNKVGADWPARVLTEALDQNARFPDPLPPAEVASTARSVASFRGVGMFDHSPKTQARRGVASAKVRRFLVYERDLEMAALVGAGHSLRAVARAFGVCHRTVAGAQDRLSRPRRAPREHP